MGQTQTDLSAILDRYDVPQSVPSSWWEECRFRRCLPKSANTGIVAIIARSVNYVTTHSLLMQEWLQSAQIRDAEEKWATYFGSHPDHTRAEAVQVITSAYRPRPHLSAWPKGDELEEAKDYLEKLISLAPCRELAVDLAWTLALARQFDEAKGLLARYHAWDLCPMLVLFIGDHHLAVSELSRALLNPKAAPTAYRELIEQMGMRPREDPRTLELASGEYNQALELYRRAVRRARSPVAAAECGYLLLRRSGIEKADLTPLRTGRFQSDTLVHLIHLDGIEPTCSTPEDLFSLALESYGRAFRFFESWSRRDDIELDASEEEPGAEEQEPGYEANELWVVLDGLSLVFRELGDWVAVRDTCLTFLNHWQGDFGEGDQELYDRCQRFLREALAKLPGERKFFKKRCSEQHSDIWEHLPTATQEYLVNALMTEETLTGKRDWSALVNDYSKAVESLLRNRLGIYVDRNPSEQLAQFIRAAADKRRVTPVKKFSRLSLSTFRDALKEIEPLHRDTILKQLTQQLDLFVRPRGRATHADPDEIWKVSSGEAERAKKVSETILGILVGLNLP